MPSQTNSQRCRNRTATALYKKFLHNGFLCATSVFSVSLWCVLLGIDPPQRHREHRGCTEKRAFVTFLCKAHHESALPLRDPRVQCVYGTQHCKRLCGSILPGCNLLSCFTKNSTFMPRKLAPHTLVAQRRRD